MISQTRISLAKVKHFKAGSQETECFTAEVLLDGVAFASAENSGHGGPTNIHPLFDRKTHKRTQATWGRMKAAETFAASLPDYVTEFKNADGSQFAIKMDLDQLVDLILADYLNN